MKRRGGAPSSCSSSTSSSSCIGPTDNISTKKPKRLRPKKIQSHRSLATSPKSRSSIYRGVTRHRWTGRFEAHLWDKTTWNNIQNKRGRQIYLGAYDNEEDAGRTYDLAALKYWGPLAILNFPVESYDKEIEEMEKMSREEYLASLRRRSSGFSRGVSKYRGVARHHHNGRWEARIGRISGNKYLYLGTYSTQEEAAAAYDRAAIQYRGPKAVTNFDISNYTDKLDDIVPKFEVTKQEDVQEKEKPNPKSPDNVQVDEASDDHHRVENLKMDQPGSMTYPMDPTEDHIEPPWDLCLDVGFNSLALPDIPLEKASELLGWLDHNVFKDDDIEFIFDYENDLAQEDAMSGTCECKADASVNAVDLKGQELSTSHSSSSLSTMASVGSNI